MIDYSFLLKNNSIGGETRLLLKAYIDGTVRDIEENKGDENSNFWRTPIIHLGGL